MSRTEAIARAQVLRESLLDHGVRSVSIELVEGRGSGGWSDDRFVGTLGHHIVSRRSQGVTPFLSLIKNGRSDLPGPIANAYGGWDEVARIICMAWANHPGRGGPWTVEAGTIPQNNGRPYLFGWEFEGGVVASDWTDSFRTFMGRCHAGTLDWLGHTDRSHLEHKTWAPTRKVDRLGYSLSGAQQEVRNHLGGDDMALLPMKKGDGTGARESKRSDVAMFQALMNRAYNAGLKTDGNYGDATAAAIHQFIPDRAADTAGDKFIPGRMITGNRWDNLQWQLAVRAAQSVSGGGTVDSVARQDLSKLRNHLRNS